MYSPSLSRVTVIKEDRDGMDYPIFCRHCDYCPAIERCPTGALERTEPGMINLVEDVCTGCGICVEACTFGAIKLDGSYKPLICDHCGGDPRCVARCPTKALSFEESKPFTEKPEEVFTRLRREWRIGE